jgi:hypothetical protein
MAEIRIEGMFDYYQGRELGDNPYKNNLEKAAEWELGWIEAEFNKGPF